MRYQHRANIKKTYAKVYFATHQGFLIIIIIIIINIVGSPKLVRMIKRISRLQITNCCFLLLD